MDRAVLKPQISFDSIGLAISTKMSVESLSARDKIDLCRWLLDDLKITEGLARNEEAQRVIAECWTAAWK